MKKIACVGYHGTGAGVVDDLFREFDNVYHGTYEAEVRLLDIYKTSTKDRAGTFSEDSCPILCISTSSSAGMLCLRDAGQTPETKRSAAFILHDLLHKARQWHCAPPPEAQISFLRKDHTYRDAKCFRYNSFP